MHLLLAAVSCCHCCSGHRRAGCMHAEPLHAALQKFNEEALQFQEKIIERAGLGSETYVPMGALAACCDHACSNWPPNGVQIGHLCKLMPVGSEGTLCRVQSASLHAA